MVWTSIFKENCIPAVFFENACSRLFLSLPPSCFYVSVVWWLPSACMAPRKSFNFITAIHKKGDSGLPSNYRPISITCTACKIIEAIIKDQLVSYLLFKGLIRRQQHAFIKKHSTITNLLQCTHDWALAVHGGHSVDAIDFARAFEFRQRCSF